MQRTHLQKDAGVLATRYDRIGVLATRRVPIWRSDMVSAAQSERDDEAHPTHLLHKAQATHSPGLGIVIPKVRTRLQSR